MNKAQLLIIMLVLGLAAAGCQAAVQSQAPTTDGATNDYISAVQAIGLAEQLMPEGYLDQFTLTAEQTGDVWKVKAALYRNVLVAEELDWPAGETSYLNYGLLPEGEVRMLVVELDAASGEVRHLTASDSLSMPEGDLPNAVSPACGGCE
jgi:hypothetical protein